MATSVTEKAHAELGPSGWDTWGSCPGQPALAADIPKTSSKYADEGTAAHELLANCLEGGLDAEDLLGKEYEVNGVIWPVTRDMADAVDAALNYVRDTINPDRGDILLIEQSVPLQHLTGEEGAEGTSDIVGIIDGGKTLVVMDYKHGAGVKVWASTEEGEPNGQMAMYGLGTLHKYGFVYDEIEEVLLVILQPRQEHIHEHRLTVGELLDFADRVTQAAGKVELNKVAFAESGDIGSLDLNPTDKGCKFCRAKTVCPAQRALMSNALSVASKAEDFEDLTLPKKASSVVVDSGLSNEQLGEIMRAADMIESYLKDIRAETERRLLAGESVPGYYLGVGKAGNRKWADDEYALKELTKNGRLKMSEATTSKVISPTQAEKLLKGRPKIWSQIVHVIAPPTPGGPSVCKDGDKNPPYILPSSTPEDFDDLDAPEVDAAALLDDGEELLVDKMKRVANGAAAIEEHGLLDD